MRLAAIVTFWALVLGSSALAKDVTPTTIGHLTQSYGNYKPKELRWLSQLPIAVREVLDYHLKSRMGDLFYRRLRFVGGKVIDPVQLLRDDPHSKNYQWTIPAYVINFDFQAPELGLPRYAARILLRADGGVIGEIDLPAFATDLQKQTFFPFDRALEVALKQGYDRDTVEASLGFSEQFGSLVWDFIQVTNDDGLAFEMKTLQVSAHTGAVLAVGDAIGMR
jgi:hypothetical protein